MSGQTISSAELPPVESAALTGGQFAPHNSPSSATGTSLATAPLDDRLDIALRAAVNQKSLDVRALDVSQATDIADRFVICSGTSERHVRSIADKVTEALAKVGEEPASVSGYEQAEWILIDYGDLIVHIFYEPTRQYYNLEDFWQKRGKAITPSADLEEDIRRLRTGISWGSSR